MGEFARFCIKCGGFATHLIEVDKDSDSGEPQFIETCLRCAGKDDEIDRNLPVSQKRLFK